MALEMVEIPASLLLWLEEEKKVALSDNILQQLERDTMMSNPKWEISASDLLQLLREPTSITGDDDVRTES